MVKRISRMAALLAASALLFGFVACSDSDSSSATPTPVNEEEEQEEVAATYAGPDSWDFVSQSGDWVTAVTSDATKTADSDGITHKVASDIEIAGTGNVSKFILRKDTLVAYDDKNLGLRIYDKDLTTGALAITGVTGKVKVTVEWYSLNGTDSRTLTLAGGSTSKVGTVTATGAKVSGTGTKKNEVITQEDLVQVFDFGTTKTNITLSASKHVFIKSIAIEDASDAVTTVTLSFPDENGENWTDKTYDIGGTSITATALSAKIACDDTDADAKAAVDAIIAELQAGVDEEIGANAVEVTSDMFDFIFFSSKEDWNAYNDEDGTNDPTPLETITSNKTVYVAFEVNDAFEAAMTEAALKALTYTQKDVFDFEEGKTWATISSTSNIGYDYVKTPTNEGAAFYTAASAISTSGTVLSPNDFSLTNPTSVKWILPCTSVLQMNCTSQALPF